MSIPEQVKIAPSVMCADFRCLERDIRELESAGVDMLHFDIMDGHFVPNFTMGPAIVRTVRQVSNLPFDIHLMLDDPDKYIEVFAGAAGGVDNEKGNLISVHVEACRNLPRTLQLIRECGSAPAVALNPATPLSRLDPVLDQVDMVLVMTVNPGFAGQKIIPSTIEKVKHLKRMLESGKISCRQHMDESASRVLPAPLFVDIEVDGNVSNRNAPRLLKAGATVLVCGTSSIFKPHVNLTEALHSFRRDLK